jgi:hypothetical protein
MATDDIARLALLAVVVIAAVFVARKAGPVLRDLLRGGPRPPSHPLPADDSRILNRKHVKRAAQ